MPPERALASGKVESALTDLPTFDERRQRLPGHIHQLPLIAAKLMPRYDTLAQPPPDRAHPHPIEVIDEPNNQLSAPHVVAGWIRER